MSRDGVRLVGAHFVGPAAIIAQQPVDPCIEIGAEVEAKLDLKVELRSALERDGQERTVLVGPCEELVEDALRSVNRPTSGWPASASASRH